MRQTLLTKCVHMTLNEYSVDPKKSLETGLDYMIAFRQMCTLSGAKD